MLAPGSQIGKYRIGRKLGQGGFGAVFLAQDTSLDREVAMKFLNPEHTATPQMLQRFLQEARSAAKIAHPGIVTVYECGQIDDKKSPAAGSAFIAMELLVGESLTARLARSGRIAPAAAMEIGRQVASALEAAHRAGIVHRDLKPDNIFLVQDPAIPSGERVKILDFGIAKLGRSAASSVQTQSLMVFGTPRYMSPEQCKSAAHVDHRSDIYTLGCILFELVTGQPPFIGQPGELIARHVLVEPPIVTALAPECPQGLSDLIAMMLAKEPEQRPPSMAAVQRALEAGGALSPGVAPTLAPDAIEPVITPAGSFGSFGIRPSAQQVAVGAPTTLGAATGSSAVVPVKRKRWIAYAAAAGVVAVAAIALAFGLRGGDDDGKHVAGAPPPPVDKSNGAAGMSPDRVGTSRSTDKSSDSSLDNSTNRSNDSATDKSTAAASMGGSSDKPTDRANATASIGRSNGTSTDKSSDKRTDRIAAKAPVAAAKPGAPASKGRPIVVADKPKAASPDKKSEGALTVSAKPPCDVTIDGGMPGRTPMQVKLPAGKHQVSLVNSEIGVADTVTVEIRAGATEAVDRDYSDRVAKKKPADKNKTINPFESGGP